MSGVRVVGLPVATAGFALAGLPTHEVSDAKEGAAALTTLADRGDTGVLLVEQAVLDAVDPVTERELMRRPAPIIVPFPSPAWKDRGAAPESLVLELLQRAIGYRVRLR
jgi:vacuolar-type H+-ATPase subunit F/Vma7